MPTGLRDRNRPRLGVAYRRLVLTGFLLGGAVGCDQETSTEPKQPAPSAPEASREPAAKAGDSQPDAPANSETPSPDHPASLGQVPANPDLSCGSMSLELPNVEYQRSSCPSGEKEARFFGLDADNDKLLELTLSFPASPLKQDFSEAELELSRQSPVGKRTWRSSSCQVTPQEQHLDASFGWHYVKMKVECSEPLQSTSGDAKNVLSLPPFSMTGIFKQPE